MTLIGKPKTMKTHAKNQTAERLWTHPVNYRWSTPGGMICHGHSVVLSRTRAGLRGALRRFFKLHGHVEEEVV